MVDYVKQLMEVNDLRGGTYIEPYAGGASVALNLLMGKYASRIKINDIDRSIYAFWYSVLNETDELCRMVSDTPVTMETWQAQHELQKHKEEVGLLELGFSTFFLNRTNRSGILNGGVIGGKDQQGEYKMDARYNKKDLIERIKSVADYSDRIELTSMDAVALIKRYKRTPGEEEPIGLLLCSEGNTEHIELMMLDEPNIKVAQYLTILPDKQWFIDKLNRSILIARELQQQN